MRRTRNRDKSYLIILFACLASATAIACGSIYLSSLDDDDYTTDTGKYAKEEVLLENDNNTNNPAIDYNSTSDNADDGFNTEENTNVGTETSNEVTDTITNEVSKNVTDTQTGMEGLSKTEGQTDSEQASQKTATNTTDTKASDTGNADNTDSESGDNATAQVNASTVLPFSTEQILYWPVEGNILIEYNMTNTVYFPTLDSYKCNPALIIQADVDMPVSSCCESIVQEIGSDEEIGNYVTVSLGEGYSLTYGQLGQVNVEEGQQVSSGDVIGYVNEPTHYYTKEGCNLYLKLTKDDEPIDPLNYLSYPQE